MQGPSLTDTYFVDVLLPVPIPRLFTYRIPRGLSNSLAEGVRVIVPFGDRKMMTGLIVSIHHSPPKGYEAKAVQDILDNEPLINKLQFELFQWMASYYCCPLGDIMAAALPSGLKPTSESTLELAFNFSLENSPFDFGESERIVLHELQTGPQSITSIAKKLNTKSIYHVLRSLTGKNAVTVREEIKEKYHPLTEKRYRITSTYLNPEALEALFSSLTPKQEDVLLKYLQLVPVLSSPDSNQQGIDEKNLLHEEVSVSALKTLVKKNVLEQFEVIISRFPRVEKTMQVPELSAAQQQAYGEIIHHFQEKEVVLFHGITGSGKTEIYIHLIRNAMDSGSQVLLLLPEIAVTTQIVSRLKKVFGDEMAVYHSRFSDNERVEVWNDLLQGKISFVVGVRSAVFLPFGNLGLIIVDEEHDTSYKQQEPSPRYHARDTAIMMAALQHAKVLLGSATPSIESYYHAHTGKYGWISLGVRYGDTALPRIEVADMQKERKEKTAKGELSRMLIERIAHALQKKEQVIVFQNRRGYAAFLSCEDCGWVSKCINCSVSLTYHQQRHTLLCHYCGYKEAPPPRCPVCGSSRIRSAGLGTEKLEEQIALTFPDAKVQRMDLDTTRSKSAFEKIIRDFQTGETDILVGTQMITKGLDFGKVSLVGIFNVDRMIHFPDFRAYERAYQLITQVSGRAGRRETQGTVVVQTYQPDHPLLNLILKKNAEDFYAAETTERQRYGYPPFSRLIQVVVKHTEEPVAKAAAEELARLINQYKKEANVMGPAAPMVNRVRNQFLMQILVKIPKGKMDLKSFKTSLQASIAQVQQQKAFRSTRMVIDVDPV